MSFQLLYQRDPSLTGLLHQYKWVLNVSCTVLGRSAAYLILIIMLDLDSNKEKMSLFGSAKPAI